MMKRLILSLALAGISIFGQCKVVTFKYAAGVEKSSLFSVTADGKAQTVLNTQEPDVCIFDCDAPVTVTVKWSKPASRVDVRPLSLDFSHKFENGVLTLTMKPKDRVVVEFDGDYHKPLFIFANEIDKNKPSPKTPGVRYFKAGKIYEEENVKLQTGESIYLEGGAVLQGNIKTSGGSDINVCGSGVIDARRVDPRAINISKGNNLTIKGITVLNSKGWCTLISEVNNITIDNYKVIAEFNYSHKRGIENDALDLVSCSNATIRHCLTYCHDDAYCLKTTVLGVKGKLTDVSYEDCIAWNVRAGNSFEIGYAINDDIENISYKNIYSIHKRDNEKGTRNSDIAIHCAGKGIVRNVSYENVYLEEADNYTIHFDVFDYGNCLKSYGYPYSPGGIENVSLKNIYLLYEQPKGSIIRGFDQDHTNKNITIENMVIQGKKVTNLEDALFNISNSQVTLIQK